MMYFVVFRHRLLIRPCLSFLVFLISLKRLAMVPFKLFTLCFSCTLIFFVFLGVFFSFVGSELKYGGPFPYPDRDSNLSRYLTM